MIQSVGVDDHKVPPNETDQVQPIDRGMGRQIKVYLGQLLDEWLDDEDNLEKWESNKLTASDRRILAHWFYKASMKALQGEAKRKAVTKRGKGSAAGRRAAGEGMAMGGTAEERAAAVSVVEEATAVGRGARAREAPRLRHSHHYYRR